MSWLDHRVVDIRCLPIGIVVAVYTDSTTGCPACLGIDIGCGTLADLVIAPTNGASFDGSVVIIAYHRNHVVATSRAMLVMLTEAIDSRAEGSQTTVSIDRY